MEKPDEETKLFTQQRFLLFSILYIFFVVQLKLITYSPRIVTEYDVVQFQWYFGIFYWNVLVFIVLSSKLC